MMKVRPVEDREVLLTCGADIKCYIRMSKRQVWTAKNVTNDTLAVHREGYNFVLKEDVFKEWFKEI